MVNTFGINPTTLETAGITQKDLFLKKIAQCAVIFDFSVPEKDFEGKRIKQEALSELVTFISNTKDILTEETYGPLMNMVMTQNIDKNSFQPTFSDHCPLKSIHLGMLMTQKKMNLY
jgi:hypothetical protein